MNRPLFTLLLCVLSIVTAFAENGHNLWLRYQQLDANSRQRYTALYNSIYSSGENDLATRELSQAFYSLTGKKLPLTHRITPRTIVVGTPHDKNIAKFLTPQSIVPCKEEGFRLKTLNLRKGNVTFITARTARGLLYGTFAFIRRLNLKCDVAVLDTIERPSYNFRILDHWDNPDGTIERGYAGHSIWNFSQLPDTVSPLIREYARFNASIGINGAVLNNVNVSPDFLKRDNLPRIAAIADVLRPYGMKVYISVNFASPEKLGGLATSDPLNADVIQWWRSKVDEIYHYIPDFGGFLVKASSEGLPGPQTYGRTHVDGANMLADVLAPKKGIVLWRAFVYGGGDDRAKDAYREFTPFDGQFRKNVIIQVKNGPVDFQPREPFSPLFGAMKHTALFPELQITQEYLGFSDHLVYLGTLFKEFLNSDTYACGPGSTIAKLTDGTFSADTLLTGIAAVANIGKDTNWCGHHFAQANWYAFGRLAWNNRLSADAVAQEWLVQTFTDNPAFLSDMMSVMMQSREAVVNYMTPIGLAHLMGYAHHYGPQPWCGEGKPMVWYPVYYHRADSLGIGFDRTDHGTNAVAQYHEPLRSIYNDPALCPLNLLLWFHHLPWTYRLSDGNTLWEELCYKYDQGVRSARRFQLLWDMNQHYVDAERYEAVRSRLAQQVYEATWWKDACLLYFQTYSKMPFPIDITRPVFNLDALKKMKFNLQVHN
jgi:alpha-glucuronidase